MRFKFGTRSMQRMDGVHPLLQQCAISALAKSQYDMTIPWMGGLRTADEQKEIFNRGASRCDGVEILSNHQSGNALDIEPVGYNKPGEVGPAYLSAVRNHFAQVMFNEFSRMKANGDIPEKMYLHWGGLWGSNGWDPQHWELVEKTI